MKELITSQKVLKEILYTDISFSSALKKTFQNDEALKDIKGIVSALVGCELRHHFLFSSLLQETNIQFNDDEKCLIYVALSNNLFLKRLNEDEVTDFIKSSFDEQRFSNLVKMLTFRDSPNDLIPNDIPRDSVDFLSLRFNTPIWLIKMWQKHFGKGITYKLLKKNTRPQLLTCRVMTMQTTLDQLIKENDAFKPSPVSDMVIFDGKPPKKRAEFFRSFDVFPEKMAVKSFFDNFVQPNVRNVLAYSGGDNSILYELYAKYGRDVNFNVGVSNLDERFELARSIRLANAKNVNLFNAPDPLSMEAAISCEQDLVVVAPSNSCFDEIRQYPDFLVKFKQELIDKFILDQKIALEGSSAYLTEDGKLIYIVMTLNRKESHSVIIDFLQKHRDFELVEERQRFPYDELDTAMYYAILKRVGESRSD